MEHEYQRTPLLFLTSIHVLYIGKIVGRKIQKSKVHDKVIDMQLNFPTPSNATEQFSHSYMMKNHYLK
jgi:hypothetical protein